MGTVLMILGGAYVGFAALLFLFQARMVHLPNMPSRDLMATPTQVGLEYESVSIQTKDGFRLHGWFVPAPSERGTVLFFHGNAGNISHRLDSLLVFHRLGFNTLIFDYRGYGQSQGSPSEDGIYRDAEAALAHLREEREIPLQDIVYFGRSLGAPVATWLAARASPGALIVESGFTSAPDMAAELYPFLPTRLLTRLRYNTLEYLRQVSCPVLIVHSVEDEIIPFRHGQELFAAAPEPKEILEIHGDHNMGFLSSGPRYEKGLRDFLAKALRKNEDTVR